MKPSVFQVNLTGILKLLSDNLYSRKEVFIRELLQNAVDAINARKKQDEFEPHIRVDYYEQDDNRGLVISDNGIGLTVDEVEQFLSRIGASSKSGNLLNSHEDDFIGQFGIGLLSCFMVCDQILVKTKSLFADYVVQWTGNIDGTYQTEKQLDSDFFVGTRVILKLRNGLNMNPNKVEQLLLLYGSYLKIPIHYEVNGIYNKTILNTFPWEQAKKGDAILTYGQSIFKHNFSNYIELNDRHGLTKGIAYILPQSLHFTAHQNHHVYIKNMFISDQVSDLLPEWAFFVKAVVNSSNLSPTASREDIYKNEVSDDVQEDLGECIKKYLIDLSKNRPDSLMYILKVHSNALKSLALVDKEFLSFISDWFVLPTTEGDLTIKEIKEKSKAILFVSDIDEFRQLAPIARANGKLVINSGYIYDTELLERIQRIDTTHLYQRVDAKYFGNILQDLSIEDYDKYFSKLESLQKYLLKFDCELKLKQFLPKEIPAIFHLSQEALRNRDYTKIQEESNELWSSITGSLFEEKKEFKSKLFLNYLNPTVKKILEGESDFDHLFLETVYINAMLMGHYPLNQLELDIMNRNMILLLEKTI